MTAMAQAEAQKNQLKYQTDMSALQQKNASEAAALQQKHASEIQRLQGEIMRMKAQTTAQLTNTYLTDDRQRLASELTFEANMAKLGVQEKEIAAAAASAEASAETTKPSKIGRAHV